MSLPVIWTKHIKDEKKKQEFEAALRHSTTALFRLIDILEDRKAEISREAFSEKNFNNPNWSTRQAYVLGELAEVDRLLQNLRFIKE